MLSCRAFTRPALRLPSAIRLSIRLRLTEMIAISLPEKNPFPSRRTTIDAAMKRGSDRVVKTSIVANRPPEGRVLSSAGGV